MSPLASLFFADKKKNIVLAAGMLFFNFFAALLEGVSFAFLLGGFAVLTGEKKPCLVLEWFSHLSQSHVFMLFLSGAIGGQLLRSLFAYLGQLATSYLTINLQIKAQQEIYAHIFRMTFKSVSKYKMGDLLLHATAPATFFPHVMDGLNRTLVSGMMMGGYLLFMLWLSWKLTFFVLLLFLLASYVQKYLIRKISTASSVQAEHNVALNKETVQNLEGLKTIHLFDRGEHVLKKIRKTLQAIARSTYRLSQWNHLIPPVNEVIAVLLVGCSLFLAFVFFQGTEVFIPFLMTFLTLTYRLGTRLQVMMYSWGVVASYLGSIHRLEAILRTDDKEFSCSDKKKEAVFTKLIAFQNVSFHYPEKKIPAVLNVSFEILKGRSVALVGPSGGGKSTLLSLLMGLFEPTEGRIVVDGVPLSELDPSTWRSLFGVVNQEVFLFHESVAENIRFGKLGASFEEIKRAAHLAGVDRFIEKLPQGYHTTVGERGYQLSGGERQRIALARALIRTPSILVLDEATSNLDSESERMIQEALEMLRGKTTIFVVAHRLSTIKNADEILVVDEGKIVERGAHEDLLENRALYSQLYHH